MKFWISRHRRRSHLLQDQRLADEPAGPDAPQLHHLALVCSGGLYACGLQQGDRSIEARVSGQATFTSAYPMLHAALSGHGLAFLPEDMTQPHVDAGLLQRVMADWCPTFPGLHAYYTSRRHPTRALKTVVDALREPAPSGE